MSAVTIGFLGCGLMLVLLALRVPVAFGLLISAVVGIYAIRGIRPVYGFIENVPFEFATH